METYLPVTRSHQGVDAARRRGVRGLQECDNLISDLAVLVGIHAVQVISLKKVKMVVS